MSNDSLSLDCNNNSNNSWLCSPDSQSVSNFTDENLRDFNRTYNNIRLDILWEARNVSVYLPKQTLEGNFSNIFLKLFNKTKEAVTEPPSDNDQQLYLYISIGLGSLLCLVLVLMAILCIVFRLKLSQAVHGAKVSRAGSWRYESSIYVNPNKHRSPIPVYNSQPPTYPNDASNPLLNSENEQLNGREGMTTERQSNFDNNLEGTQPLPGEADGQASGAMASLERYPPPTSGPMDMGSLGSTVATLPLDIGMANPTAPLAPTSRGSISTDEESELPPYPEPEASSQETPPTETLPMSGIDSVDDFDPPTVQDSPLIPNRMRKHSRNQSVPSAVRGVDIIRCTTQNATSVTSVPPCIRRMTRDRSVENHSNRNSAASIIMDMGTRGNIHPDIPNADDSD